MIPLQEIVQEVSKTLKEINFYDFENKLRGIILTMLDRPLSQMKEQEEIIKLLSKSTKSYMRRLHEVEFIIHKFAKSITQIDEATTKIQEIDDRYSIFDLELKTKITSLECLVEKSFPERIEDYKAIVDSNIIHTNRLENTIETLSKLNTMHNESTVANCKHTISELQKRVDVIENRAKEKSDAYEAIQINVDAISQMVAQQQSVEELRFKDNFMTQESLIKKFAELQRQFDESERRKMDKYFTQVAQIDQTVRKLQETVKMNEEVVDFTTKHFLINDSVQQYNATFETLARILKGEELARLCDYMQEKQDELVKKKNNISSMSRKESKQAVNKFFQRPIAFARIPRKPNKLERMATMNEMKHFFDTSMLHAIEQLPQLKMVTNKTGQPPFTSNILDHGSESKGSRNKDHSRSKASNLSNQTKQSSKSKGSHSKNRSRQIILEKVEKTKLEVLEEVAEQISPEKRQPGSSLKEIMMQKVKSELKRGTTRYLDHEEKVQEVQRQKSQNSQSLLEQEDKNKPNSTDINIKDSMKQTELFKTTQQKQQEKFEAEAPKLIKIEKKISQPMMIVENTSQIERTDSKNALVVQKKTSKPSPKQKPSVINLSREDIKPDVIMVQDIAKKPPSNASQNKMEIQSSFDQSSDSQYDKNVQIDVEINKQIPKIAYSPGQKNQQYESKSFKQNIQKSPQQINNLSEASSESLSSEKLSAGSSSSVSRSFSESNSKSKDSNNGSRSNSSQGSRLSHRIDSNQISNIIHDKLKIVEKKFKKAIKEQSATFDFKLGQNRETVDQIEDLIKQLQETVENNQIQSYRRSKENRNGIEENSQRLQALSDHFSNKLEQEKQFFGNKLENLYKDFICKVDGELTRRNRLRIDMLMKFTEFEERFKFGEGTQNATESTLQKMVQTIKKLAHVQTIQSAINIQDERDREWVSLFGVLEAQNNASHTQPRSSLAKQQTEKGHFTLNQECISCSGNNQHQLRLFKAACLNYKSNPVLHEGKFFDRREIISLQAHLVQKTQDFLENKKIDIEQGIQVLNKTKEVDQFELSEKETTKIESKELIGERQQTIGSVFQESIPKRINSQDDELKEFESPNGQSDLKRQLFGDAKQNKRMNRKARPKSIIQDYSNTQSTIMSSIVIENKSTLFGDKIQPQAKSLSRTLKNQTAFGGPNPVTNVEIGVGGFNSHTSQIIQGSHDFDSFTIGNSTMPFDKKEMIITKSSSHSKQQLLNMLRTSKDSSKFGFTTQGANPTGTTESVAKIPVQRPKSVAGLASTLKRQTPNNTGLIQEKQNPAQRSQRPNQSSVNAKTEYSDGQKNLYLNKSDDKEKEQLQTIGLRIPERTGTENLRNIETPLSTPMRGSKLQNSQNEPYDERGINIVKKKSVTQKVN